MIVILHLKDLKVFTPVVVVIANSQSLMIWHAQYGASEGDWYTLIHDGENLLK